MDMLNFAENEVKLACQREKENSKDGEFEYGCACYDSALKAFKSLLEDNHSGMSIVFTKNILNRLIDGKVLTPIKDTDDIWSFSYSNNNYDVYQCSRMSSLFKDVYKDGTVKYTDVDRVISVDVYSPDIPFRSSLDRSIIDELFPIQFPYFPEDKPYIVYKEEFLYDEKEGDFDTVGILYVITPSNERKEINRFFKFIGDEKIEIDRDEYYHRFINKVIKD